MPLLDVRRLQTRIDTDRGVVRAVDDVTLHVEAGEAVGLVGESGCGKSMTALSLMRLVRPPGRIVSGEVRFEERDLLALTEREMRKLRGGTIAMVFQDPMTFLNPLMRVGDQIVEAIRLHQAVRGREAARIAVEALAKVRVPAPENVVHYFPHQLSGGMRQRVLIAMAISSGPKLLIADEPTTALDVTVQAQILRLLADIRRELSSALLLITHDLGLVAEYCDRVYVMYAGQIIESGSVYDVFERPSHPYTRALLRSTLSLDRKVADLAPIGGSPPSLIKPPAGCRFHPRCPDGFAPCPTASPPDFAVSSSASARCWLHERRSHAASA